MSMAATPFNQPTDDVLRPLRDLTERAEEEYLPGTPREEHRSCWSVETRAMFRLGIGGSMP